MSRPAKNLENDHEATRSLPNSGAASGRCQWHCLPLSCALYHAGHRYLCFPVLVQAASQQMWAGESVASFESLELRIWRLGSEAWLCRWQGRLGWFTSSLGASVSSSENSRGGLDGVSGPGRSEFLWLQHLDRLSTWCPQSMPCGHCFARLLQPPRTRRAFSLQGFVVDGQTRSRPRVSRGSPGALPSQQ